MAYADVSLASTSVSNPVFGAYTNFFFNSAGASGNNDQSARNSESATAALGSAASSTGNAPAVVTKAAESLGVPPMFLYLALGGFFGLAALIFLTRK